MRYCRVRNILIYIKYDITNKKSFESIKEYWYNELKGNTDSEVIFSCG